MRIALTGHRPQRLGLLNDERSEDWNHLKDWLYGVLTIAACVEPIDIYSGMASGSDILLALTAIQMKKKGINMRLHCVLPCKNYNATNEYCNEIKTSADEWIELSDEFYEGCDNVRDQYLVNHCDILLAIWDKKKSGGVWSTMRKAQKVGKPIICCPEAILEKTKGEFGLFDYNTERTKRIKRITIVCEREIEDKIGNISTDTIVTELDNVRDYIVKRGRKEICIKYGVTDYSGFSTGKKQYNTILEEMGEKER